MLKEQKLANAPGVQKENWGSRTFFRDNKALILVKNAIYCFVFGTFLNYCCLIISKKMHGYPQFSFWIPVAPAKICFSRKVINFPKILLFIGRHHP